MDFCQPVTDSENESYCSVFIEKMNEVKKITINTPEFYQRKVAF